MNEANPVFTPSQLNTLARDILETSFSLVWVEGELSNVTKPASGHLYFTLKDSRAQIRCALFKPKSQWLKFVPKEGLKVLARGRLTLYEARGDYQLVLDHLEEAGEGALRRAFEELKAKLEAEGLFAASNKRPLPAYIKRLAIITSPTGAAIRDVLSVLARRFPLIDVDILPALVQGETAAPQITHLLQKADNSARYDAVLLTRGGGSLEDLWAFNDETLTRAIAASHIPVISAIGHETDFTLADFAADLRAPTPSVAAELLVPDKRDLLTQIRHLYTRLHTLQQHRLNQNIQRTDRAALQLQALRPQAQLQAFQQRQHNALQQIKSLWQQQLNKHQQHLQQLFISLQSHSPSQNLKIRQNNLTALKIRLRTAINTYLQQQQLRLHMHAHAIETVNPLATINRGYSLLTRSDNGEIIYSITQVKTEDKLQAQLSDGLLHITINNIDTKTK